MEKKVFRRLSCSANSLPEVIASAYNDGASFIEVISVPADGHLEDGRFTVVFYYDSPVI